jgi:UDP-glucose 4-epimerase
MLTEKGYEPIVIDNLAEGHIQSLDLNKVKFYKGDISDNNLLDKIFK